MEQQKVNYTSVFLRKCEDVWQRARAHMSGMLGDEEDAPLTFEPVLSRSGPVFSAQPEMDDNFRRLTFTFATIALGAKLAAADGDIKPVEVAAFFRLFVFPEEGVAKAKKLFHLAHEDSNDYTYYARQLSGLYGTQNSLLEGVLSRLCSLAEVDGRANAAERQMLEHIASLLNVPARVMETSLTPVIPADAGRNPYRVLGVDARVPNEVVKQAYRNHIRRLHPDRLMAEGYAQEAVAEAENDLQAINEAYLLIARKRKIK